MGYVASPHAASLAGGQTHAIGVVVPNVTRWFFGSVVHGAEELLREEGYDLLLYTVTGEPAARQRLFNSYLLSKRVDAVMVLALRPTPEEVASLDRTGSPTVVVGGSVPGWSSVRIDDVEAAGDRRTTSGGARPHEASPTSAAYPTPSTRVSTSPRPVDRQEGYRLAMQEAGLRIEPRLGGHRRLHRTRRPLRLPTTARKGGSRPPRSSRAPTRWRSAPRTPFVKPDCGSQRTSR